MTEGSGKRKAGSVGTRGWGRRFGASLLLLSVGCYEYREARVTDVRPDATVHVVLSAEAATALAGSIGPNATSIDGRVLSVDTRTLRLSATQIGRAVGPEEFLRDEPIDVPSLGALSISIRSVDRVRTVLAIGGILASVFAAHALTDQPGIIATRGGPTTGTK